MNKLILVFIFFQILMFVGYEKKEELNEGIRQKEQTIVLAAASSLEYCLEEIIPIFNEEYPLITIEATYDSSGKLKSQIGNGAVIDIFISASSIFMNQLEDKDLIYSNSIIQLLENKLVLITPKDTKIRMDDYGDILKAARIAIGNPEVVPAGQYAKNSLENMGLWDQVEDRLIYATNVTEVLSWVVSGNADAGIVYATDATITSHVTIIGEAPKDSINHISYPIGIVKTTSKEESARLFTEFLRNDKILEIFEKYGFTVHNN